MSALLNKRIQFQIETANGLLGELHEGTVTGYDGDGKMSIDGHLYKCALIHVRHVLPDGHRASDAPGMMRVVDPITGQARMVNRTTPPEMVSVVDPITGKTVKVTKDAEHGFPAAAPLPNFVAPPTAKLGDLAGTGEASVTAAARDEEERSARRLSANPVSTDTKRKHAQKGPQDHGSQAAGPGEYQDRD